MTDGQKEYGHRQFANPSSRKYITAIVVFAFVIYGPNIDAWLFLPFRLAYLIAAGVGTWFFLKKIWRDWLPGPDEQYKFGLLVLGVTAGFFLAMMVNEITADTHLENTEYRKTGRNESGFMGYEPVGEWFEAEGPDIESVFSWGLYTFLTLAFYHNISLGDYVRKDEEEQKRFSKMREENEEV